MYSIDKEKEAITEVQKYLLEAVSDMKLDTPGAYAANTKNAVRAFQIKNGLTPSGRTDRQTFEPLYEAYISTKNTRQLPIKHAGYGVGDYDMDVIYLKERIGILGEYFSEGELFESGEMYTHAFGEEVRRIRRIFGLKDTARFDEELLLRVNKEINLREKAKVTK